MGIPEPVHLTYADYRQLPDDGRRYELCEGVLEVSPSATLRHQDLVMRLVSLLLPWITNHRLGVLRTAPLDVILADDTVMQPDLLFVSTARRKEIEGQWVHGPPDLVIEVLSPGTAARDRGIKRQIYSRHGVKEYWLVDPETRCITILGLEGTSYRQVASGTGDQTVESPVLQGLSLEPADIFEDL